MNYEKKYKEALERARKLYEQGTITNSLAYIFPELAEDEDEKIRKQLIHYFEYLKPYVPPIKDCFGDEYGYEIPEFIAWLEKQAPSEKAIEYLAKNHSSSEISDFQAAMNIATAKAYDKGYNDGLGKQREQDNWAEELNTKIKELHKQCLEKIQENMPTKAELRAVDLGLIVWHSVSEEPEEMKELFCEWESDDATWHDVAFYDKESHTFRHAKMPINVTKWVYVDELLEKQVEQKPVDKVESKFKVGDWVVFKNKHQSIYQVEKIEDGYYILRHTHGGTFRVCILHDEDLRLWSIKDAKNGDILFAKGRYFKEYVFIYSEMTEDNVLSTYCGFDIAHNNFDTKLTRFGRVEDFEAVCPATKEQRETLFKAMHEAGYEWSSEHKKLIKNDACAALTKKMLYDIILDLKAFRDKDCSTEGKAAYQREIDWLENLKKELEE